MNNGGDTCEMATVITAGTVTGNTTGLANNYNPGCTGDITPGADTVFKISVPAGQRLTASATPGLAASGNQYDLALYLIAAPASNCTSTDTDGGMSLTCLAASDNPNPMYPDAVETGSYFNSGSSAVEVFIVIDSYFDMMNNNPDGGVGLANEGPFTLVTSLAAPAAGDRCDTAITLSTTTPLLNQDMANFGNDYDNTGMNCRGSSAPDVAYQVTVPAGQLLSVTVTPDPMFDVTISAADGSAACGVTCISGVDVGNPGDPETYTYKNATAAAQTLFLIVDGYGGSTGTFGIAATLSTPAADDTCSGPTVLTPGAAALTAQAFATYSDDYNDNASPAGCAFNSGPDRVYSVSVPNNQRLTVTVTPTAMVDPAISLVDGSANCGMTCLASADPGIDGDPETLTFTNRSGATQNYLVIVDVWTGGTGTFDIVASVAVPPADDVCAAPTALPIGTQAGTTVGYTDDYANGTGVVGCSSGTTGADRVYQLSIPGNQRGTVTVTPTADAGFDPSINLVEGAAAVCAAMPRVCAAGANSAGGNRPESVSVFNTTGAARSFFAIVDSSSGSGAYNIGFAAAAPGVDDTCTTSTTTLMAGTRNDNLTGFTTDYGSGTGCASISGPDRAYKATLAANAKYTFVITPTQDAGFDPAVDLIAGPATNCEAAPRTCASNSDSFGSNRAETGGYTNNTGAALDLFVVVGDYGTTAYNRDYSLVSTIGAAPAGESCGVPLALTAGMLAAQTTAGATADVVLSATSTGCAGTRARPDRVYTVAVPAMQMATIVATPGASENVVLNVIDGAASACNAVTACATSADTGLSGVAETVTFRNTTAAAKTVFVVVSGTGSSVVTYSLNTTIQ